MHEIKLVLLPIQSTPPYFGGIHFRSCLTNPPPHVCEHVPLCQSVHEPSTGQKGTLVQFLYLIESPIHSFPPNFGFGLLHSLLLACFEISVDPSKIQLLLQGP